MKRTLIYTPVQSERLVKLVRSETLHKTSNPEVPPRVEYELNDFGKRFSRLLDEVDRLQAEM